MNNSITESYVTFENAKLLANKGFDIFTPKVYIQDGRFTDSPQHPDFDGLEKIDAPTTALAIAWIRENFGIHISVTPHYSKANEWMYEMHYLRTHFPNKVVINEFSKGDEMWESPEEAENAAITHVLKHLI